MSEDKIGKLTLEFCGALKLCLRPSGRVAKTGQHYANHAFPAYTVDTEQRAARCLAASYANAQRNERKDGSGHPGASAGCANACARLLLGVGSNILRRAC